MQVDLEYNLWKRTGQIVQSVAPLMYSEINGHF